MSSRKKNKDKLFMKNCLNTKINLLDALDSLNKMDISLLTFMVRKMNTFNNLVLLNNDNLVSHFNKSIQYINRSLKSLKEKEYIRKINNGTYMIHPNLFCHGTYRAIECKLCAFENKELKNYNDVNIYVNSIITGKVNEDLSKINKIKAEYDIERVRSKIISAN